MIGFWTNTVKYSLTSVALYTTFIKHDNILATAKLFLTPPELFTLYLRFVKKHSSGET